MRAHSWGGRSVHADIWAWTSCGTQRWHIGVQTQDLHRKGRRRGLPSIRFIIWQPLHGRKGWLEVQLMPAGVQRHGVDQSVAARGTAYPCDVWVQ